MLQTGARATSRCLSPKFEAKLVEVFHAKAQSTPRFFLVFFACSAPLREKMGYLTYVTSRLQNDIQRPLFYSRRARLLAKPIPAGLRNAPVLGEPLIDASVHRWMPLADL
jgi:hypothetical protein